MKTTWLAITLPLFSLVACGGDQPPPKPPESPAPTATTAPEPAPAPSPTPEPAASTPPEPTTPPPPAGPAIKETIGTVTKVEVMAGGKKKLEITKAPDVESLLKAIGTDQVPSGPQRRCPDDWVVVMKDASGAEKGSVGLCKGGDTLGPEFWAPKGERKGITLADEATVKKALKIEDKPAAKAASADAGAKPAAKK